MESGTEACRQAASVFLCGGQGTNRAQIPPEQFVEEFRVCVWEYQAARVAA